MKISYERLNQIIEEEVSRFKRLNEETEIANPVSAVPVAQLIKDNIKNITDAETLRRSLMTAVGKIQDVGTLKQIQGLLQIQDKKQ